MIYNIETLKDILKGNKDMELTLRAEALQRLLELANLDTKDCYNANKLLLEAPWSSITKTRGRPSNEEVNNNLRDLVNLELDLQEHLKRITLDD